MLNCQNCTRNFARALFSASTEVHVDVLRLRRISAAIPRLRSANYSTEALGNPKPRSSDEQARLDAGLPLDVQTFKEAGVSALKESGAIARFKRKGKELSVAAEAVSILDGKTPIDVPTLRRHARLELRYVDEPYKLAERTLILLKNGEADQALQLVRNAGAKGMDCTVGWNHILNILTKTGRLDAAWRLFNEMKRLGQRPDSYTITLLLRGYAKQPTGGLVSLPTALKIYESTYRPNSSVKPHITHSNAMLEACARQHNMEMLFDIAARLPRHGPCAPDEITYTIIFNALANANPQDKPVEHVNRQRLISYARSIWPDILEQWKSGRLVMNEKLVCSMGRVLLTSHLKSDRDEVFSLVQQTMRIPRQFPELPKVYFAETQDMEEADANLVLRTGDLHKKDLPSASKVSNAGPELDFNSLFVETERDQVTSSIPAQEGAGIRSPVFAAQESGDMVLATESTEAKDDLSESRTRNRTLPRSHFNNVQAAGLVFAKPGNSTMSLLVDACASTKQYKGAVKYWDLLRPMFTPDTVNYIEYMKLLKDARASSKATDVLKDIYKLSISSKNTIELLPVFFWHGLSACVRAKETKTALQDGTRIMAMLQMCAAEPQPSLIELFTALLGRSTADFPPRDIGLAVESLMITFGNLKSFHAFGRSQGNGPPVPSVPLTELIHEIDPKWRPVKRRHFADIGRSRQDILTEARTRISPAERNELRDLGRTIELAVGRVLKLYANSLDPNQLSKIRADLHRVRAWFLPREKTWASTEPALEATPAQTVRCASGDGDQVKLVGHVPAI